MQLAVIAFLIFGLTANVLAWSTFEPAAIGLIVCLVGASSILFLPSSRENLKFFLVTYSVFWSITGVSALYLKFGDDGAQLFGDAQNFFRLASGPDGSLSLSDIYNVSEGAIAIKAWHFA